MGPSPVRKTMRIVAVHVDIICVEQCVDGQLGGIESAPDW